MLVFLTFVPVGAIVGAVAGAVGMAVFTARKPPTA
jgi:hypothetical protein